jgi:hypothetical protein
MITTEDVIPEVSAPITIEVDLIHLVRGIETVKEEVLPMIEGTEEVILQNISVIGEAAGAILQNIEGVAIMIRIIMAADIGDTAHAAEPILGEKEIQIYHLLNHARLFLFSIWIRTRLTNRGYMISFQSLAKWNEWI